MARRTKEEAAATRNMLLDAAERVFYEKGVSRASLGDIAQAAGATRGAIYWHFKDKVDLYSAMLDRVTLPLEGACLAVRAGSAADPLQSVRSLVREVFRVVSVDERARRVFEIAMYRVELVVDLDQVRERHICATEGFKREMAQDIRAAAALRGLALSVPSEVAALGVYALMDGLLKVWLLRPGSFELEGEGCEAVDVYLKGLGFDLRSL
jgi:TetR/AcrR family acrAB operon transcriptional repressor